MDPNEIYTIKKKDYKQLIVIILGIILFLVAQHYLFKWIDKENNRVSCVETINSNCI